MLPFSKTKKDYNSRDLEGYYTLRFWKQPCLLEEFVNDVLSDGEDENGSIKVDGRYTLTYANRKLTSDLLDCEKKKCVVGGKLYQSWTGDCYEIETSGDKGEQIMKTVRHGWLAKKYFVFSCPTCRCLFIEDNREKWQTEIERVFDADRKDYVRKLVVRCRCPECNTLATAFEVDSETHTRIKKEETKDAPPIEELNG